MPCLEKETKMANLNKVLLIGRLTRDPELRYGTSGVAVAKFGLQPIESTKHKMVKRKRNLLCRNCRLWKNSRILCKLFFKG